MRSGIVALATALAAITTLPASAASPAGAQFDQYRAALAALSPVGNVVFEYAESRSGPTRTFTEQHRVYRGADGRERDETLAVDGAPLVPAQVRFSEHDVWPYDVAQFAVDEADYSVLYIGPAVVDGRRALEFSTVRETTGDFAVTALYIDPLRHLPLRETFAAQGSGCSGSGVIDFAAIGRHWLASSVSADCSVAGSQGAFRETIRFSAYQFPAVIPPDVLTAP
ncbi:MAG TPA: hypothetical protein VEJ20_08140 [Candidatus Eremiobacteraceae bacterium]|nr:hypothetical protein [Candidatus Eremiobacteraceae bacterium]